MEDQNVAQGSIPQQVNQDALAQSPPTPIQKKPGKNYWMISTIILLLLIVTGGVFYFLNTKDNLLLSSVDRQPTDKPTTKPATTGAPSKPANLKSYQIRIGGLQLTFPGGWIPVFAAPQDGKNLVYFAQTDQGAQLLEGCASQGQCDSYPFKLEDFGSYAVWENFTIENFIKQTQKNVQIDKLQRTTLGGYEAWLGYINDQKTRHQAIIRTDTPHSKSFVAITASASEDSRTMLEEYISILSTIRISEYKSVNTSELATKKGFVIKLASSLNAEDSGLLRFILESLLGTENDPRYYRYFLYTESTISEGSNISGPSYPKDNYLNNQYYLLTDNDHLTASVYGTSQIKIEVLTPEINSLGLYLADSKYCAQDADCQYRADFCTIGAFNPYHKFITPWGCGAPDYEGVGNSAELWQQLGCQEGADVEVKYDSLKCVNSSCQIVNAEAVCQQ